MNPFRTSLDQDPIPPVAPAPGATPVAPAPGAATVAPAPGAAPVAPESYAFAKVKATTKDAAGKDIVVETDVDATLVTEIGAYAKANGLSQKQAQALMDRELKLIEDASAHDKKAQADGLAALKAKWQSEAKSDKDFGGEGGAKFDENLGVTKRALAKFFPEIAKDANSHPFLDHPQVLKGLLKIGQLLSPDGEFIAGRGNDAPRDPAKSLFPNMA